MVVTYSYHGPRQPKPSNNEEHWFPSYAQIFGSDGHFRCGGCGHLVAKASDLFSTAELDQGGITPAANIYVAGEKAFCHEECPQSTDNLDNGSDPKERCTEQMVDPTSSPSERSTEQMADPTRQPKERSTEQMVNLTSSPAKGPSSVTTRIFHATESFLLLVLPRQFDLVLVKQCGVDTTVEVGP